MTDSLNQNQVTDISAPKNPETATKMVSQDEVNYLITKVKERAYEDGKREALSQVPQNVVPEIPDEVIAKKVEEKIKAITDRHVGEQIAGNFYTNVKDGREKYEDFDNVAGSIDWTKTSGLIPLANAMPNAKDVIYHLGKEPERFNQINLALQTGQVKVAENLIRKFSESIAENEKALEKAKKQPQVAPLSQLKPSVMGADGGMDIRASSIKDLRRFMNSRGK